MSLSVKYLGLELRSPVIAASSPFTASIEKLVHLEENGIGAVVLKSVFEEQITGEAAYLEHYNDYPEAADYLAGYIGSEYIKGHLGLIREAKEKLSVPVIASINCRTADRWLDYAVSIGQAGADALELNINLLPVDAGTTSQEIEQRYADIVDAVSSAVQIPVSVKLSNHFTNILHTVRDLYYNGAKGVVMFNRFFEPDIDIDTMTVSQSDILSSRVELRNNLRPVAMCSSAIPTLDIAVSTGVHTGEDVVKSLLAGAKAVQVCTALYNGGVGVIDEMNRFVSDWMDRNSFYGIGEFCGYLNFKSEGSSELYQRLQYMKFFPKE